ncbi:GTP-binding protein [Mycoplasmopsis californica HAZ160_1]|uniref:Ribosome biogenesis GTPase A n=1 Tax=Mycoplasmopsis californica HAZ160_1 TaxID=1397850 RepID=A0AAT9F8U4_9BACT|nr:ribosome biogenesis GTPase YlqF [Mycoplasmopsis californica]BAP01321.1 GTP-binding protein [Mycoplasmopsis californica HAZ160_1]BBG41194.1 GTP-binding protein [Mycoplasmopsis californica]BBG41787.1 GTP-binding protein [Mycoplasmopsis californica]BBG42381.1 GTP-binding protein [Mycoplasmopsis californica]BBG42956.1 GTP-binding protein [Mycoplasmopsis californica]
MKISDKHKNLINWYPGHMAKGMREIKQNANLADIFIIVLDARCPISSYNEDFDSIAPQKPRLFIITKSDMMDLNKKSMIQARFKGSTLLWLDLRKQSSRSVIIKQMQKIMNPKILKNKEKGLLNTKIKAFVVGVPNAGKSTLINLIIQKKSLKVANYPGVTKAKQWVSVDNFYFMDTPGILIPKQDNQQAATKLAMIGSIETKIFPIMFLAYSFLDIIHQYYPEKFLDHFNIDISIYDKLTEVDKHNIFNLIALNKNFKLNNKPDLSKVYKYFLNWTRELKNVTYD